MKYQRILLKISGESLAGDEKRGINDEVLTTLAKVVKKVVDLGVQLGIVVGGGNFWRGRSNPHMDRVTADQIGMLATTMNAMAVSDALERHGVTTRVMNAINMSEICEPYIRKRALRHLEKGRVLVFAGGTGSPFFTTDSAAALKASEIEADVMLKATLVDGVYDKDPHTHDDAKRYDRISLDQVLQENLKVMDATAAALCRDNDIPVIVFSIADPDNIYKIAKGEDIGTVVYPN